MYPYSEKVGSAAAARHTLKKKKKNTTLKNVIFRTAVKRERLTVPYILIALSKTKLLQNFPTRTLFLSTGIQKT